MIIQINRSLVESLIKEQFPQWDDLPIHQIELGGWDNRSYRLGDELVIRLPSAAAYSDQVEKEQLWLPKLSPHLSLEIPTPIACGKPNEAYPWHWSILKWLPGRPATPDQIADLSHFAVDLANFLMALQQISPTGGPPPGKHNFYRGGLLKTYDEETQSAIKQLAGKIDAPRITQIWEEALNSKWEKEFVWVHGDISADNLLIKDGKLSSVIDFGMLGVGDPACDLAITWTFFYGQSRETFQSQLPFDESTWARAKGWTLWKSLITWEQNPRSKTVICELSK